MRHLILALSLALPLMAHAAGLQTIEIPASPAAAALTGAVWTPCAAPPSLVKAGAIRVPGTENCPIVGEHLPLVVISHGFGGWAFGHHDLASVLADAGFVVAAIDHPVDGGRSADRSQESSLQVWRRRPEDIHRLIDFMLSAWSGRDRLDPERIGMFGFSRGAVTGLLLLGATLDHQRFTLLCADYPKLQMCQQVLAGERLPASQAYDARIRAAVLADPLASIFGPAGLAGITVPVQLWASEFGGDGVVPGDVDAMARWLPGAELHEMRGGGHFGFLAPCGADRTRLEPDICADRPGFDRVAFHAAMNRAVVAFFRAHLGSGI